MCVHLATLGSGESLAVLCCVLLYNWDCCRKQLTDDTYRIVVALAFSFRNVFSPVLVLTFLHHAMAVCFPYYLH